MMAQRLHIFTGSMPSLMNKQRPNRVKTLNKASRRLPGFTLHTTGGWPPHVGSEKRKDYQWLHESLTMTTMTT
jgi:hypothetical protein